MSRRTLLAFAAVAILVPPLSAAPPLGDIDKMDFGKTPDGTPVDLYVLKNGRMHGQGHDLRRHRHRDRRARPQRQAGRRRPRLRQPRRLPRRPPLLRRHRRPGRQPDRRGQVHARRQGLHAGRQQRPEHACTAASRASTRSSGRPRKCPGPTARPSRFTYRSPDGEEGYPGNLDVSRHLHADEAERAADRLQGDDRQGHAGQPDEPQLLQPGRPGVGHDPRPRADARRRQVHAGRRHADPDGRDRAGRRARRSTSPSRRRSAQRIKRDQGRARRLRPQLRPPRRRRQAGVRGDGAATRRAAG